VQDKAWCWHMRFGHLNFAALKSLGEKDMVKGMPAINSPNQLCEVCIFGKHARKNFSKVAASKATKPLQLVHADVCGPIVPPSFSKNKYFLLFIDDFSRKMWVYFLRQKSKVFSSFKNFKALVEKESGFEIKALRSDRGGEFTSREFKEFCATHEIRHPLTVPRSPQQNGVVERKNITILNMARSMLKARNMPKEFWAEVVSCAVYLSNRAPTSNLKDQTPQEAWSGRKPSVNHLRVFGNIAYTHVPKQERSKLDDQSAKYVYVGYDTQSKGYKLYNPSNGKVVVSRDVEFDEEVMWNWEAQEEKTYDFLPLKKRKKIKKLQFKMSLLLIYPPYLEEEEENQETAIQDVIPPHLPPSSVTSHAEGESTSERPKKTGDIRDIYERSDEVTCNLEELYCLQIDCEPLNFEEIVNDKRWRHAMEEEVKSIEKNDTWELTTLPKGHEAIGVKWVYKTKKNASGEVERYKAQLVVKGYKQKHGVDYDEVYAPVARMDTIRLLISLAAQMKWKIYQLDVKSAFLNGYLEEVYIEQPSGFVVEGHEDKVLKLKRALYGLKQAPRAWNSHIDKYFQDNGFVRCLNEYALYIKTFDNKDTLIVCLYVDDLIFIGSNPSLFEEFKKAMSYEFEMTNLGLMSYYLGLKVKQLEESIFISQGCYAKEVLKKFKMFDCNPVNTLMESGMKLSKFEDG